MQKLIGRIAVALIVFSAGAAQQSAAQAPQPKIGIVIMHGKGGHPTRLVAGLASFLEEKGYLVANMEMPWSGRRQYDVDVSAADKELESALGELRRKGATKLFIAGHSQGGLYALHSGGIQIVDGVIAIAPGGNVANTIFRQQLGEYVEQARRLVAEGKGNETTRFFDYEGAKGTFPVVSTPAAYLSWFNPDGAMNQLKAVRNVKVPVLFIGPTNDYPGLIKVKHQMYGALPRHSLTRLYEPSAGHTDAPNAARDEILRWTLQVAVGG